MKQYNYNRKRMNTNRARGMTLLDTSLALAVFGIALAGMMQMTNTASSQLRAQGAAGRLEQISLAAQDYIKSNSSVLLACAQSAGTTLYIPVGKPTSIAPIPGAPCGLSSLQGSGYLPNDFVDRNSYGQQTALLLNVNTASDGTKTLEGLITTFGGQAVRDSELGTIVNKVGASGGMMLANLPAFVAANTVEGAYGGWSTAAGTWPAGAASPTVGHAMVTLSLNSSNAIGDNLNRFNTGNPEANKMYTDILMNNHNISGAYAVDTQILQNTTGPTNDILAQGAAVYADKGFIANNGNSFVIAPNTTTGAQDGSGLYWSGYGPGGDNVALSYNKTQNTLDVYSGSSGGADHKTGIYATGDITGARFVDAITPSYYIWPSGTSYVNVLQANSINVTGAINASDVYASNNILAGNDVHSNGTIGSAGTATFGDTNTNNLHVATGYTLTFGNNGNGLSDAGTGGLFTTTNNGFVNTGNQAVYGNETVSGNSTVNGTQTNQNQVTVNALMLANQLRAQNGGFVTTNGANATQNTCGSDGLSFSGSISRDVNTGVPLWCDGLVWHRVTLTD